MDIVGNSKFTLLESFITPNAVVLHLMSKFRSYIKSLVVGIKDLTKLVLYNIQFLKNDFGFT